MPLADTADRRIAGQLADCFNIVRHEQSAAAHEIGRAQIYAQRVEKIEKQNKHIKGISEHVFDYTTYQGYDDTTLYWYNAKSELITSRDIDTLNYKKAKRIAKKNYKIKCESIVLGYGYNNPVYEIRGSNKLILLDYDSFERVYERKIQ